jgi:cytosine/adenosine deaminase-related metal-dependent hydrolase
VIIGPCTVITGGPRPAVFEDAAVRVLGAHISHVGPAGHLAASYPNDMLWPARGRVLLPGFVNTHAHLARHLARGLPLRTPHEWKRYEQALSPADVYWAVAAALAEGVRHGVTTVCDFHRSGPSVDVSLTEVVAAAADVGVRVATCWGISEADAPHERRTTTEESRGFGVELGRRRDGKLRAMLGVQPTTLAGMTSMVEAALDIAGDSLPMHVDLALDLTPAERGRVRTVKREGVPPAVWAHAEIAPRELVHAARERGDLLSAIGFGSVAALVREADVAWGSDASVNAPPLPDISHGWTLGARADSHYRRLFVNGPQWAGRFFGEELGTIAPGAPADLVLVDYRPATEFSARTLPEHLWAGLLRAPVGSVMVGGEIVMDNGVLVTLDEREISARAQECAKRVWEQLG